jgi:DNA-binding protein H-NS
MPNVNVSRMTVEALMGLREQIDETLVKRRAEIEQQLKKMGAVVGSTRVIRAGKSVLKGRKVPPKYRGPSGETWAGRGARPRWLVAAVRGGKKLDDFLIDKSAPKRRKSEGRSADLCHHGTDCPNCTWCYYWGPHHCVIGDRLLCVE